MRIREYAIRRYGPLHDSGRVELAGFNLIYGNNEDGKTLTIDALVKLLLGKASKEREFEAIERVNEIPEGYIIVEDRDGKEYKLPEQGTLPNVIELSAGDCSNIFIIRDSNLSISNEQAFYTGVTERLTGLRTRTIESIIDSLRTVGKITPRGIFRDVGDERLKSRIEAATALVETIDELRTEFKAQNIDRAEERIVEITDRLNSISSSVDALNEARLRERYEKGTNALNKLVDAQNEAASIDGVNEDDLQKWRDNERDVDRLIGDRDKTVQDLEKQEGDLESVAANLKDDEAGWNRAEEQKRRIDETIRPLVKQYEERLANVPQYETRRKFFGAAGILAGVLFGISLIGALIAPGIFFSVITGLLFVCLIVSGSIYYLTLRTLSDVSVDFQRLNNEAARYGIDAENLPRIVEKIEAFEEQHRRAFERIQERRRQVENLRERVKTLTHDTLPGIDREVRRLRDEIDDIRNTSGVDSIDTYRDKLHRKSQYRTEINTQAALLKSDFGNQNDTLNGNISFWQNKLRELMPYKEKAIGIDYNESTLTNLNKEQQALNRDLDSLIKGRSGIEERMKEIERKANRILQTGDEFVFCKTLHDLSVIQTMLQDYIRYHEETRQAVTNAIEIFTAIKDEEQKKVSALFGADRPVSKYYRYITGGKYKTVEYDQAAGQIEVETEDGSWLSADKLSGGAYDQLYFAIRVALGEELLKGDTGFFILDDPFIKSDIGRLREQIKMLHEIAGRGWQLLFFSAKQEVWDILKPDSERNAVKLIDYRNNL